jgi:NAD-dependent deacetylase
LTSSTSAAQIERLASAWRAASSAVVLTGAGLSTGSGIPDFRSPGGLWERFRAVTLQEFIASDTARAGYWRYKQATWQMIREARPNAAHRALADLVAAGRVALLVTQNIDGLHEKSGVPEDRLIRIHGTDSEVVCLSCGARRPRDEVQEIWERTETPPTCSCGGWWKPATISFGQSLVAEDLESALGAARQADLMVAAGTSLVVGPINAMVPAAADAGATVAILTGSETPFDHQATIRIQDPVEEILPAVRDRVLAEE